MPNWKSYQPVPDGAGPKRPPSRTWPYAAWSAYGPRPDWGAHGSGVALLTSPAKRGRLLALKGEDGPANIDHPDQEE